ncbi:Uncharacterised protein [Providencia stuartii]|nr:Uncharacterised protein [Providencia stuartii]
MAPKCDLRRIFIMNFVGLFNCLILLANFFLKSVFYRLYGVLLGQSQKR